MKSIYFIFFALIATDDTRKKHSLKTFSNWQDGMEMPGATQVGYLKNSCFRFH